MEEKIKITKDLVADLFEALGVSTPFTVDVIDDGLEIVLTGEENGMLIGYHGETLEALQLLIGLMLAKKLGDFTRVSVEIGEYKKNRMAHLEEIVANVKAEAMTTGRELPIARLKPWERRYVHMLLKDDADVATRSEGEGMERTLIVYPKA